MSAPVTKAKSGTARYWLALGAILLLSVAVRVAIADAVPVKRLLDQDSAGYLAPTRALVQEGRFSVSTSDAEPEYFRTPGYPVFLAVLSQIGDSVRTLAVEQALLTVGTAIGVFFLALRWSGSRVVALVAATLAAFEPLQIWASGQILTEALAAGSYVVVALVATSAARARSPVRWAFVGVALAAATYVRPSTYFLPLFLAPVLLVVIARGTDQTHAWRRALVCVLALVLPFVALIGAWQLRNHEELGTWRFSGVDGYTMYHVRAPEVVAHDTGTSFAKARTSLDYDFALRHYGEPQGEWFGHMYSEGLRIVRAHPRAFAVTTGLGMFGVAFGRAPNLQDTLGSRGPSGTPALAFEGILLVLYALAVFGGVEAFRNPAWRPSRAAVVLVIVLVLYTVVSSGVAAGVYANARYRAPLMPLLCPFAAMGAVTIVRRLRGRRDRVAPASA